MSRPIGVFTRAIPIGDLRHAQPAGEGVLDCGCAGVGWGGSVGHGAAEARKQRHLRDAVDLGERFPRAPMRVERRLVKPEYRQDAGIGFLESARRRAIC